MVIGDRSVVTNGLKNEVITYTLEINNYNPDCHIHIGIITEKFTEWDKHFLGSSIYGWSFQGHIRTDWCRFLHKGDHIKYGKIFQTGDILKVNIDTIKGILSYNLNDEDLGVAATGLPNKVALGISLMHDGCQVTIQEC